MKELSQQSRALLAEVRRVEHISAADKSRIHAKLAQRVGAGLALGSALTATATAAKAAHTGAWATVMAWLPAATKVIGVVAVTGAVSVGMVKATRVAAPSATVPARAVSSVVATRGRVVAPVASAAVAPAPSAVALAEVEPPRSAPIPQPARTKRALAEVAAAPAPPIASGEAVDVPSADTDGLSRQVAAIREARIAIRSGDARAALAALDRELPEGQAGALAPEAALARVAAYCRLGNADSARRIANRFAAQFPQSPLVARMRESCAGMPVKPSVSNF